MNIKLKFNPHYWTGKTNKNQGFAIPMALGIGVCITLVGLSMLIKTHSDQAKAFSQKQKSESLSAAEIGVARIQSLINNNPALISSSSQCRSTTDTSCWGNLQTTPVNDTSDANASSLQQKVQRRIPAACSNSQPTATIQQDLTTIRRLTLADANDVNTWEKVTNVQNPDIDVEYYYRLVSYQFQEKTGSGPGQVPGGTGTLIIEGLAKHPNATNNTSDSSESRSLLKVDIDVPAPALPSVLQRSTAPGLWLTSGATNDGKQNLEPDGSYNPVGSKYRADVLLTDCSLALPNYPKQVNVNGQKISGIEWQLNNFVVVDDPGTAPSPAANFDYQGQVLKLTQPTPPPLPSPLSPLSPSSTRKVVSLGELDGNAVRELPRPKDVSDNTFSKETITRTDATGKTTEEEIQVYEYVVSNIDIRGNDNIVITPGKRVKLYVTGNIGSRGTGGIVHDCSTAPTGTPCKPTDLQIFGYSTSATASICLRGNAKLDGFILAPGYDVGVTGRGTGSSGGTPFSGSIWAKSWGKLNSCSSRDGGIDLVQTASWNELPSSYKDTAVDYNSSNPSASKLLYQLGQVTAWEQIESGL